MLKTIGNCWKCIYILNRCEDASRQTYHPHTPGMIGVSYLAIAYHFITAFSIRTSDDFCIISDDICIVYDTKNIT